MIKNIILIILMATASMVQAQSFEYCGHDHLVNEMKVKYPGLYEKWDKTYQEYASQSSLSRRGFSQDTIFTVQLVFHVIWSNALERVDEQYILSQVDALNEAFGHYHKDTASIRAIFKDRAGDVGIRFKLATIDPNGDTTNGINYVQTTVSEFGRNRGNEKSSSTGGADAWDSDKYVNVWVCDFSVNGQASLLGYATPPVNHLFWTGTSANYPKDQQGLALHFATVGKNNPRGAGITGNPQDGRTAVHEMGHYLGLRHIWGDGGFTNGCNVDDFIFDTPNQRNQTNFNCNKGVNTCTSGNPDEPDMLENYMDYSNEACMGMFTKKQSDVMRISLVNQRPGVIVATVINTPAIEPADWNVYYSNNDELSININGKKLDQYSYELYNFAGQRMAERNNLDKVSQTINAPQFANGLYVLSLYQKGQDKPIHIQKVLLQK
jgi:hypothetical protein